MIGMIPIPPPQMPCSQKRGDWWKSLVILPGRPLPPTLWFDVCLFPSLLKSLIMIKRLDIYIYNIWWWQLTICIYVRIVIYIYLIFSILPLTYPMSYRHRYWWQQRSLEYFGRLTRRCLSGWFGSDLSSLLAAAPLGNAFFSETSNEKKKHIGETFNHTYIYIYTHSDLNITPKSWVFVSGKVYGHKLFPCPFSEKPREPRKSTQVALDASTGRLGGPASCDDGIILFLLWQFLQMGLLAVLAGVEL